MISTLGLKDKIRPTISAFTLLFALAGAQPGCAANPLTAVLEDFESGSTANATAVTASNSASTGDSNSAVANVNDAGSNRLQMTDVDGVYNGIVMTFPGALTAPGNYLITADVKVDDCTSTPIGTFGMGLKVGQPDATKVSDLNAGYVMNLAGSGDAALGYQTIGASIQVDNQGSFPKDLTIYFSTDPSGNSYNASAYDGNFNGTHRGGVATWAADSTNTVCIDNIKRIGPGNFGEERHMWISIADSFTNFATLDSQLVAAKNNNFNCIDILARYRANLFFVPNRTDATYANPEPYATAGGKYASASNDPIQYAIDRGHELGLKVYVSFGCFLVADGSNPYPSYLPSGSIQWYYNSGSPRAMVTADNSNEGLWADPSRADVRNYTKNVLLDLVKNYDIDGVIFDRMRFPSYYFSYNPQGLAEMGITGTPVFNDATFRNARREIVTTFLQDCYESSTNLKPWMVVGTCPIAYGSALVDTYNSVMQYWPKWTARKTANRALSFGCCDLFEPQFYRTDAPSNTTLMNKAQYGDIATYSLDYGLMPGAASLLAPIFYHPSTADTTQSMVNAQNITDGRALAMNGFGFFSATKTYTDMSLIRAAGASSAGTDVLGTAPTTPDYLFKANYDNVKPNAVGNFAATPNADGTVLLSWTTPSPAADGETAARYIIYKSTTSPVKEYRANEVTYSTIPGTATSYTVMTDYQGSYYYRIVPVDDYNNHGPAMQIGPIAVAGEPVPPADVIVDNPAATFTGTWTAATGSTDKYGADYRYKSVGSGLYAGTFNATLPLAGNYNVYEWHCAGSNRATNARHTIQNAGTAATVLVNQVSNGGKWNKLGQYSFSASTYPATIDDLCSGTVIVADAMRWEYVVTVPTVPTNVTATPASQTSVQLNWTDNANNERNYYVARSTTHGGPYTDIAVLGVNQTSFTDTGLSANTSYYYVVRVQNSGGTSVNSSEASVTTLPNPPAAPSGLIAATNGSSKIDLAWGDNSDNETNFVVARSTVSGGPYTDVATLGANVGSYTDAGLSANTSYYYVVRAKNTGGNSANATEASATTLPNPPVAPSALATAVISQTQINLTWTDNANNETNFVVARAAASGGPYTDIATLGPNVASYSDTGLTANTDYYYVVRARNTGGDSANAAEASATTLPNPPAAPSTLVAAVVNQTQINLTWTDNANNETNFVVARAAASGGPYTDIATLGADVASYSDAGLTANTAYYYVVRAKNTGGNSANSAQASATTLPNPPTAPSALAATVVSQTQINLTWTDSANNETNFVVARATTSGGPYADIATIGANVTSYSDTGLTANTAYYYVVRARNTGGDSASAAQATATTLPNAPAAPSNLAATAAGQTQINLTWTDNSSNEVSFIVARATTSGGPYVDIATLGANVTAYSSTGLTVNTTYYYVVRATNTGGTSANSAQASATTLSNPPAAPSNLVATASSTLSQVSLTWTDNASNETNMIVARSTTSGGPYTDIATLAANTVAYTDTTASDNTTYYYVVRTSNAGGSSANSAQATVKTSVPDKIVDNAQATITGTWTLGTSATDKYGADYRSKSKGTGTAYLTYAPAITANGAYQVYEWHSAGTNRAVDAPHVVTYNGGSATVKVNQQANGGKWNLLGTYSLTSGNKVQITDAIAASQTVIADAVKFVWVPAPATPTGLTATAVSAAQVNLTWTDNASNESNYVVARSTTSGGPYTDIATLAANTTSYSNTGLTANTTYYYVVRATNVAGSSANSAQATATSWPADLIMDNTTAGFTASANWSTATSATDKYGADYRTRPTAAISDSATWAYTAAQTRTYEVYAWWSAGANRSATAPYVVSNTAGTTTVNKSQQANGGSWQSLGQFAITAGSNSVKLSCWTTTGYVVIADAIKVVPR